MQAMTGNRYGFRPLPPKIDSAEFDKLRKLADELSLDGRDLLDSWYCRDTNAIPNIHVLKVNKDASYNAEIAKLIGLFLVNFTQF